MFICMQKHELHPWLLFLEYSKDTANLLFLVLENARPCWSIMIVLPCKKLWFPKCWNQLVGNFEVYLHAKNQLHHSLLSEDIAKKKKANLLFWVTWACLPCLPKMKVSIWKNLSCLFANKKSILSLFSLRYCKDIARL